MTEPPDFFISYTGSDVEWAEWIAWELEQAGHTVVLQAWDFVAGSNFVAEMDRATSASRTIAVLSPAYLDAAYPVPEWGAAFGADPTGVERKLVPIRVVDCQPAGLLASVVYIDFVGLDADAARTLLHRKLEQRAKPESAPRYPGHAEEPPAFPGHQPPRHGGRVAHVPTPGDHVWVKLDDLLLTVDIVDDLGDTVELSGSIDQESVRLVEAMARGYGPPAVRLSFADRVTTARLVSVRRRMERGTTRTTVRFENVEPAARNPMRISTAGFNPDDLVEFGMRRLLLGEPLPDSLQHMEGLTYTGIRTADLVQALAVDEPDLNEVVRLVIADGLVSTGNASHVTQLVVGRKDDGSYTVDVTWVEPRTYDNVEPLERRVTGDVKLS